MNQVTKIEYSIEKLTVHENDTGIAFGHVLVSAGEIYSGKALKITVGAVGFSNMVKNMYVGDFLIFERNENELYDVRLLNKSTDYPKRVAFQVSRLEASSVFGQVSRLQDQSLWDSGKLERNDKIKEAEAHLLHQRLERFEKRIIEKFTLNQRQHSFLADRIKYLKEATNRQGQDSLPLGT